MTLEQDVIVAEICKSR